MRVIRKPDEVLVFEPSVTLFELVKLAKEENALKNLIGGEKFVRVSIHVKDDKVTYFVIEK